MAGRLTPARPRRRPHRAATDRPRSTRPSPRPWLPSASAVLLGGAYSGAVSLLDPFTRPMLVATALPSVVVAAVAVRRGWHRRGEQPREAAPRPDAAAVAGSMLISAVVVFQLAKYVSQPRHLHPTISALAGAAFASGPTRALAFALWLWVGWYLVER